MRIVQPNQRSEDDEDCFESSSGLVTLSTVILVSLYIFLLHVAHVEGCLMVATT
jgi:hypothetical protein